MRKYMIANEILLDKACIFLPKQVHSRFGLARAAGIKMEVARNNIDANAAQVLIESPRNSGSALIMARMMHHAIPNFLLLIVSTLRFICSWFWRAILALPWQSEIHIAGGEVSFSPSTFLQQGGEISLKKYFARDQ